jgi:IS30 family transposase
MARTGRPGLSMAQKSRIWEGWQRGESMSHIGRELGKHPASVFGVLKASGGIMPQARCRSERALSLEDREAITRGIAAGSSFRAIAGMIGRSPSTVSREVARNGGRGHYRAVSADCHAWDLARRPKPCLLAKRPKLRHIVTQMLMLDWSPEQISGWLRHRYPSDEQMQISHETIYRSLYIQARGVLKKELQKHLRSQRVFRQSKQGNKLGKRPRSIIDGIPISERPPEAEDRAIPGHWEGDLIAGSNNSHIATVVERRSRFTMLVKVKGKDTKSVVDALAKQVVQLPKELRKSLTWDRGAELADHKRFTVATDIDVYFCDPSSPWQRGTNENTNRLLRQYFPKGTNLSLHSQAHLNKIAMRLNQRPRKTLEFMTPADKLRESVATTG